MMFEVPSKTSERVIEEHYQDSAESHLIYLMHIATYEFAAQYVDGRRVLDFGCGTGYGAASIANRCASIEGVDISCEAIDYATEKYRQPNLRFTRIQKLEQQKLPFADASFDTILSFQVIEHIADTSAYLAEVRRLLKPGGVFIVATPDRSTRLLPLQRPWNKYHVHEYSGKEFVKLLATCFSNVELLHMSGKRELVNMELERVRRVMWLTLPFTFPFIPERLRIAGLSLLTRIRDGSKRKPSSAHFPIFTQSDIAIGDGLSPSLNLIALARSS